MDFREKAAIAIVVMSVTGLGAGSMAWADSHRGNDGEEHAALFAAPIKLGEAVSAAEAASGARAISAELEQENGAYAYTVELFNENGEEQEAYVDVASGIVTLVDPSEDHQNGDEDRNEDYEDGGDRD